MTRVTLVTKTVDLGWIDLVSDFGADPTGNTGGQAALLQRAINQIQTAAGVGSGRTTCTIYIPNGTYLLDDAQQSGGSGGADGGAYTGQFLFPARDFNTTAPLTLRIVGDGPSPQIQATATPGWGELPEVGGTILKSTAVSGNICDVIPVNMAGFGYMSNVRVAFENLTIRAPNNPQCGGLKLNYAGGARVFGCTLGVNAAANAITQPSGSGYGLWLPHTNNSDDIEVRSSQFYGWPTGLSHGEHTTLDHLHFGACMVGIECQASPHLSVGRHLIIEECPTGIKAIGACNIDYVCAFEGYSQWSITPVDLDDGFNGYFSGRLGFVKYGPGGRSPSLITKGASNLAIMSISDSTYVDSQRPTATSDNFQRPAYSSGPGQLDSGQVYDYWTPTWAVTGNKAYIASGGPGVEAFAVIAKFHPSFDAADHTIQATITTGTGSDVKNGLFARYSYPNTCIAAWLEITGGTNQIVLGKIAGGAVTNLATSTALTLAKGVAYAVAVKVTNTVITVAVNGVTYISYSLSGGEQTTYNGNTKCGMYAADDDGTARWAALTVTSETVPNTVTAAPSHGNAIQRRGFQHLWKLSESSGSAVDSILGLAAGTIQGAVTQGAAGFIAQHTAYSFPGVNTAYVLLNSAKILGGNTSWTVLGWIKTSASGSQTIYAERASSGNDIVKLDTDSTHHLRVTYRDDAGNIQQVVSSGTVDDGNWHLVAGIKNAGVYSVSIDGGALTSTTNNTPTTNFTDASLETRIGGDKGDGTVPFNGSIAYVGVATAALGAQQLQSLFYNGLANALG